MRRPKKVARKQVIRPPAGSPESLQEMGVLGLIKERIAKTGVTLDDVFGRRKTVHIVRARHEVIYFLRRRLGWSYPYLGEFFGVDSSTALVACDKVDDLIKAGKVADPEFFEPVWVAKARKVVKR